MSVPSSSRTAGRGRRGSGPAWAGSLALLIVFLLSLAAPGQLAVPLTPARRLNDYANALSPADRDRLEQKLAERERQSANQVVIAVFRSLQGESLEDYSVRLAQAWRIGQKGLDNGVVFLVFLDDRKMRLEVGYGLEATLTDAVAASILRDAVAPHFREGRLADGLEAGLDAIAAALAGTYPRQPVDRRAFRERTVLFTVFGVLGALFLLGLILALRADPPAQRRGWTGGRHGWEPVRRNWPSGMPWSGGRGSSSGWGSSSGGFRGGGGSFGGGGASGSW